MSDSLAPETSANSTEKPFKNASPAGWEMLKPTTTLMPLPASDHVSQLMVGQLHEAHGHVVHPHDAAVADIANEYLPELLEVLFPNFLERAASLA